MPLIKFQNKNKYGNWRSRIFYNPTTDYSVKPKGFGKSIIVSLFKYKHINIYPPHIYESKQDGKTYILPTWQEVIKGTTVKDIDWVRPTKKEDKVKKEEYKTWKFKSKSSDSIYKVTQKGINNFICTCPGVWRSKDRSCIHIKEIKNEKNN